jgi:hypothetical protein
MAHRAYLLRALAGQLSGADRTNAEVRRDANDPNRT